MPEPERTGSPAPRRAGGKLALLAALLVVAVVLVLLGLAEGLARLEAAPPNEPARVAGQNGG